MTVFNNESGNTNRRHMINDWIRYGTINIFRRPALARIWVNNTAGRNEPKKYKLYLRNPDPLKIFLSGFSEGTEKIRRFNTGMLGIS